MSGASIRRRVPGCHAHDILVSKMKTSLVLIACGLLAACAGTSYRVVQSETQGDYLVAQTPSEIRYLSHDSGFYSPIRAYGIYPWWNYTYYSPNFYPHYFSVWQPTWPDYAAGYGRRDWHWSGPWPPHHVAPVAPFPTPSGPMDPPGSGAVPDDRGIGPVARTQPGNRRNGGRERYREMMHRGFSVTDGNPGPAVSPSMGASALSSPTSPAWSQTRSTFRPSPTARIRPGKPASRTYRSVDGPPRQRQH